MHLTATHINYCVVCPRKLWLFANGIQMEHNSDTVADGKLLHETSYPQRAERYTDIELSADYEQVRLNGKIDFYDSTAKVVHEIKRSNKIEKAHEWQVKFYLWLLMLNGIQDASATLEYPSLRRTDHVELKDEDIIQLKMLVSKVIDLTQSNDCPPVIKAKVCKSCSYYELCYIQE